MVCGQTGIVLDKLVIYNYKFRFFTLTDNPVILLPPVQITMPAPSLAPRALYQEVAEQLRQRIFNRELAPGSWIDELRLAKDYGISRTPLREALKVLAAEGLVTMKVRRGAYVTEVSEQDLADVYHVLALLESDAAGLVATQATEDELAQLQALHTDLERAAARGPAGRREFFVVNEAFHMRLLEIARNRWSRQLSIDLRKVMKLNRQHSLLKQGRIEESLAEHATLMQALAARDATAATSAMRTHFRNGLEAAA